MNILPKKSWHVRNKDNVARVRRDEAKALEEEREVAKRKALAEQEARIRVLRERAKAAKAEEKKATRWDLPQEPSLSSDENSGEKSPVPESVYTPLNTAYPAGQHINLFEDFEQNKKSQGANREYEKEKKKAQEDYEKKIGYLTYLGQSAAELSSEKPWYETISRSNKQDGKDSFRATFSQQETLTATDPLKSMKAYLNKKKQTEDVYYGRSKEISVRIDEGKRSRKRPSHTVDGPSPSHSQPADTTHSKPHKHKKEKKHKKHRNSSPECPAKPSLEELRAARVQREAAEKQRSIDLISKLQRGSSTPARSVIDERSLKYNTVYMSKRL
ncbi:leukocyte receptor cluster member 1 homolog [Watersipora subatra]|uniref:leukocyte receptor cluster member 1 homolog n=1 Tax=Watersipora subatra TaxID=2589382 RepID=UPI00355AD73C